MNIFYAPPSQIRDDVVELRGQEAIHAAKALRYQRGDNIKVVDGQGGWYEGKVQLIADGSVRIVIQKTIPKRQPRPKVILGMGIIKKRDRLEFAVEKAVELGVKEIALFQGEHSVKKNVRIDRLESIILSAMKQSLRAWLPRVKLCRNLQEVIGAYKQANIIVAHEAEKRMIKTSMEIPDGESLLLVGPEGGFSQTEISDLRDEKADIYSLGHSRLRTETAAITLINQFNYCCNSLKRG